MVNLRPLLQMGICSAFLGVLLSCGGSSHSDATLQSIEITPPTASAAAGTTTQLTATGIYSDGGHRDVTYDASWSSSSSAVANVNAGGVASAASQGTTTISAKLQGVTGSGTLTVTAATLVAIEVTPALPSIAKGRTLQFVATGIFSDNSTQNLTGQVTWSSSNASLASISTVSGSNGLASATGAGSVTISAASGNITGSTTLTVTGALLTAIEITPNAPSIAKGVSQAFVAMGIFSDNSTQNLTTQVTWSSDTVGVAVVSNSAPTIGTVTATGIGTAMLSASTASLSASIQVNVTAATLVSIQVNPPLPSIASGLSQQFTAIGIYTDNSTQNLSISATWATTAPSVATVSNAAGSHGLATSSTPGSANISATLGGVSGSASLTVTPATLVSIAVTPANATIAKGLTKQMAATGTYTDHSTQDLTTQVTFGSDTPAVATISNAAGSRGFATSAGIGITTITASLGAVSGTTTLSVSAAVLVSIQVTASSNSIAGKGLTQAFVATGTYTDATTQLLTTQVTWSSSATTVAIISNAPGTQGVATSVGVGTTTITATSGSIFGTAPLNVVPAILLSIMVTPPTPIIYGIANMQQMVATGSYNDLSTQDLTTSALWSSSVQGVATIDPNQGLATSAAFGSTTITAAMGGISGSVTLTVTAVAVTSITVTFGNPANDTSLHTTTQLATATGTFNDGNVAILAGQVNWTSADPSKATINSSTGLITWAGLGTTAITAALSSVSGSANLTVAPPTSLHITTPSSPATITGLGLTQQFVATGDYPSGAQLDLTHLVTWSSSQHGVATINVVGLATSIDTLDTPSFTETATIQATLGSLNDSQVLTVKQSFSNGSSSIYSLLGTFQGSTPAKACGDCHVSGGIASPPFYVAGNAATTFSNMSGVGSGQINLLGFTAGHAYDAACVNNPDPQADGSGMSDFSGSRLCHYLSDWLTQTGGGTNN